MELKSVVDTGSAIIHNDKFTDAILKVLSSIPPSSSDRPPAKARINCDLVVLH
jgi:hypothetical protein